MCVCVGGRKKRGIGEGRGRLNNKRKKVRGYFRNEKLCQNAFTTWVIPLQVFAHKSEIFFFLRKDVSGKQRAVLVINCQWGLARLARLIFSGKKRYCCTIHRLLRQQVGFSYIHYSVNLAFPLSATGHDIVPFGAADQKPCSHGCTARDVRDVTWRPNICTVL